MDETLRSDRPQADVGLADERRRAEQLLAADRAELDRFEQALTAQLEHAALALGEQQQHFVAHEGDLDQRRALLAAEAARIDAARQDLTARELAHAELGQQAAESHQALKADLESRLAELEERVAAVVAAESAIAEERQAVETAAQTLAADRKTTEELQAQLTEQLSTLDADRKALAEREADTAAQRQRMGHKFRRLRDCQNADIAKRRAELEQFSASGAPELGAQLQAATRSADQLRQEVDHLEKLLEVRSGEASAAREDFARAMADLEQARRELAIREAAWLTEREATAIQLRSAEQLERQRAEDQRRQTEQHERQRAENLARQSELDTAEQQVRENRRRLAGEHDDIARDREQLSVTRAKIDAERGDLAATREKLEQELARTKQQRRRIASELKQQRAAQMTEVAQARAEMERFAIAGKFDLEQQLAAVTAEGAEARWENAQLNKVLNERAGELADLRREVGLLSAELEQLRSDHDRLTQELAIRSLGVSNANELDAVVAERNDLACRLMEIEKRVSERGDDESAREKTEYLQQRFEMAIEEVRDLKRRNTELESKLTQNRSSGTGTSGGASGGVHLDWASQKRRLLESLEADFPSKNDSSRLTIEGTIRITDDVITQKDREIAELRKKAEHAGTRPTPNEIAEAAQVAQVLDKDELVRAERDRLEKLQAEWRETLRKAEIDISMERARIARDRAEIEEKLRHLESQQAQYVTAPGSDEPRLVKPARGRWLTRLGLKDLEE